MLIGIDTNVLVRYIVRDDQDQTQVATAFIEGLNDQTMGFVSLLVLCEVNWVLKRAYKIEKAERLKVIETIVRSKVFEIENVDQATKALKEYASGEADFSDYLILCSAMKADCYRIVSFDRRFLKVDSVIQPEKITL